MTTKPVQVHGYTRMQNGRAIHVGSYVQNRRRADILQVAIDHFGRRKDVQLLSDPAQAWSNCDESAVAFTSYLESLGMEPELVTFIDYDSPTSFRTHVVTRIDGEYIDWAARQYYPGADVPDIYEDCADRGFQQAKTWPGHIKEGMVKLWSPHRPIKWEDAKDDYERTREEEPEFFEAAAEYYE